MNEALRAERAAGKFIGGQSDNEPKYSTPRSNLATSSVRCTGGVRLAMRNAW